MSIATRTMVSLQDLGLSVDMTIIRIIHGLSLQLITLNPKQYLNESNIFLISISYQGKKIYEDIITTKIIYMLKSFKFNY